MKETAVRTKSYVPTDCHGNNRFCKIHERGKIFKMYTWRSGISVWRLGDRSIFSNFHVRPHTRYTPYFMSFSYHFFGWRLNVHLTGKRTAGGNWECKILLVVKLWDGPVAMYRDWVRVTLDTRQLPPNKNRHYNVPLTPTAPPPHPEQQKYLEEGEIKRDEGPNTYLGN